MSAGHDSHTYFARDLPPPTDAPASYEEQSFIFVAASSNTLIQIEGPVTPMYGFYFDNLRIWETRKKPDAAQATD